MVKKQETNPYAYGYARMPRIIRKGYKNLTNMQKLLYIYLRDLCGEDGTCYRSYRSLKDETGFSIGYLSGAIPILHNEGLIHAEMRKTPSTHWEVWHISVIDIWEKNAQFLKDEKEKCSPDEHLVEQSVQDMNRSVHQMNRIDESVHGVNESVHAMILNKNHTNNENTENNNREEVIAPAIAESNAPAPINLTEARKKRDTDPSLPVVNVDYEKDDEPTEKYQAIPKQTTSVPAGGGVQPAIAHVASAISPPPSSSGVQRGASVTDVPTQELKKKPRKPEPPLKCATSEIQRRIDEHRGYALEDTTDIIRERTAIKTWCGLHELTDYEMTMRYIKNDPYWRKPENLYRFGGVNLIKETPKALARLREPLPMAANGYHSDMVEWQGQLMTVEEADAQGYNGGFGLYK